MGTNFYFENNESNLEVEVFNEKLNQIIEETKRKLEELYVSDHNLREIEFKMSDLERVPERIHIGKRSAGWKPLFQTQDDYYVGIEGMKEWFKKNRSKWSIVDEYGKYYTWGQLERELINWEKDGKSGLNGEFDHHYKLIDGYEWMDSDFS